MDRQHIEAENVVERYLSGDLTVREAREFEKYCADHPQYLATLPIPVRLKTRLSRRPLDDSETGMFQAIPSSTTHAALETSDDDPAPGDDRSSGGASGIGRGAAMTLGGLLLAAVIAAVAFAMQVSALRERLKSVEQSAEINGLQAPGSVQRYRVAPVRGKPPQATLAVGWARPPQLLDLYIDVSEGKYNQFLITIDRADGTRLMQLRRIARDSNRELRLGLNSSAFGPGEFLLKIDGYTWRGQVEEIGWVRLGLQ